MYYGHSGWVVILVFGGVTAVRYLASRRRRGGPARPGSPTARNSFTAGPPARRPPGTTSGTGVVEPTTRTGTAAGWFADPFVHHERRYWSGTAWTEHVTDAGVPGIDPPPPPNR